MNKRPIMLLSALVSTTPALAAEGQAAEEVSIVPQLLSVSDRLQDRVDGLIGALPLLAVALLVVLLGWFLSRWVGRWERPFSRLSQNGFIVNLSRQISQFIVFVLALLLALDILDATAMVGAVLGTAGVVGLAVGFAFKDVVENYLAGVLLSLRQPFRPNDHVAVDGYEGKVVRLTSRATILLTFDGNHVRIPNAVVFKGSITNFSRNPLRRFDFAVGIGAGEDFSEAQRIALQTLAAMRSILNDPEPSAIMQPPGDFCVNMQLYAWVDQTTTSLGKAKSEAIRLVLHALDEAGIDMPEPIRRVQINAAGGFGLAASGAASQPAPEQAAGGAPIKKKPAPPVAEQSTAADTDMDEQIAKERGDSEGEQDLLSHDAPQE